jgi:oligopeptide/dipeptide ABC transporter ATP-binding protein
MSTSATPTLHLDDVVVEFQRKRMPKVRAVAGASLSVRSGEIHGLVGESGCGKTTLARAASGLLPISAGAITFEGRAVTALTRRARSPHLRRLQMVFQDPYSSLNPRRSVENQLRYALRRSGGVAKAKRAQRIAELLDVVGLPRSAAGRFPSEFSGGQRQRICIARALAAEPSMIIADEPISALDASAQAQISNLLTSLAREFRLAILFISHDLAIVRQVADVVTVMYLGKMVERAPTQALWDEPLHPYTQALTAAVPAHDGEGILPQGLPGEIPDPAQPPSGCRLHPRCRYAFDRCKTDEPPPIPLSERRFSACWLQEAGITTLPRQAP